jgi:hypothetical protein
VRPSIAMTAVTPGRGPQAFLRRTRTAAGGGFSPSDISGLSLWLHPSSGFWQDSARTTPASSDGDPVGAWDDASGNADHATQATAGARFSLQTAELNGLAVVRLDGGDMLQSAANAGQRPVTVFAVVRPTNFGNKRTVYGPSGGGGLAFGFNPTSGTLFADAASVANLGNSSGSASADAWVIVGLLLSGSTYEFRRGGAADGTGSNSTSLTTRDVQLGANQGAGSEPFIGDFAEIIMYDTAISGADVTNVEGYLATKYGL